MLFPKMDIKKDREEPRPLSVKRSLSSLFKIGRRDIEAIAMLASLLPL
jgi:hypothetical protein